MKRKLFTEDCLSMEADCTNEDCCYYHQFIHKHCAYTECNKTCPIDNLPCNSSAYKGSSLYDCRNDSGFETRPCIGEQKVTRLHGITGKAG